MRLLQKKVLIVGAGFGGVSAALEFSHRHFKGVRTTLVNPIPHFEYHASLYRALTGRSPLEVCIPLRDIFSRNIEVVEDFITDVDFESKIAYGKSKSEYHYDYIILSLGSEPAYYDIAGLRELSFSISSISQTMRLKKHLHEIFSEADSPASTHIIVVGGGPTGVETAGELAIYTKKLAKTHGLDESMITIDLVTSSKRVVPQLPKDVSDRIIERLHRLGVNMYFNRRVMKEEVEEIYLKDMQMRTKTVIWAAGVEGNHLYKKFGLPTDKKGRVIVDNYLRPLTLRYDRRVFIIGDGASTEYSGMAQTAIHEGTYVAENVIRSIYRQPRRLYEPKTPAYAIPVGPRWAATMVHGLKFYGLIGWWLRKFADLRFFLSILPFGKAITAWKEDGVLWESCPVCRNSP